MKLSSAGWLPQRSPEEVPWTLEGSMESPCTLPDASKACSDKSRERLAGRHNEHAHHSRHPAS